MQAFLIPAWERWVVCVPEAHDVHAILLDPADAVSVAQAAAALVLDVDPSTIRVVIETRGRRGSAPPATDG